MLIIIHTYHCDRLKPLGIQETLWPHHKSACLSFQKGGLSHIRGWP